jgi:hypothetical protein
LVLEKKTCFIIFDAKTDGKTGQPHMAKRAIELTESRLLNKGRLARVVEYYDDKLGRFVGKHYAGQEV